MVCEFCGSTLASPDANKDSVVSSTCPNCGKFNAAIITDLYKHKVDDKGKQYNPFSVQNPAYIPKGMPVTASYNNKLINNKCKYNKNVDNSLETINHSDSTTIG